MELNKKNYMLRLIDKKIEDYLSVFGAISIEGPKWCGKTWTSLNHAKSAMFLDDDETRELALLDVESILNGESPELIDEWNLVPQIWDKVRRKCDQKTESGNYILTGSTTLKSKVEKEKIHHSGAGRICKIKMHPMSLYESKDSNGFASITDMLNGTLKNKIVEEKSLIDLARLIVRGGWPANIDKPVDKLGLIPKGYIETILDKDIAQEENVDKNKMRMLLKSLSRNETAIINNKTILRDIEECENEEEMLKSRTTISDYLDILDRLYLIENQDAYSENYRSPERLGKSPKRHLVDPSLATALLDLTPEKLIEDLNTFGFMFEALVERDLRIYMDYLDGRIYHFRDNVTGLEIDSILEFPGGEYAAVEIKLGVNKVEEAISNLNNFYKLMNKKPKFMCVIVGKGKTIYKDAESGIYVLPITELRP